MVRYCVWGHDVPELWASPSRCWGILQLLRKHDTADWDHSSMSRCFHFLRELEGGVHREDAIFLLSPVSSLKRKTLLSVIQTLKRIISIQRDDPSFSALPVMGLICCSAPCVVGLFYPKTNEQHFSCFRARRHYSRFHQHSCSGNIQARWFQGLSR